MRMKNIRDSVTGKASVEEDDVMSDCPLEDIGSEQLAKFSYCSELSEVQCRTLILILESLIKLEGLTASDEESKTTDSRSPTVASGYGERLSGTGNAYRMSTKSPSSEENAVQVALLNLILARFDEILAEYKEWQIEHGSKSNRKKRSIAEEKIPEREPERLPVRTRRADPAELPFKLPEKMTPEMQKVIENYLAWRKNNGYGKMSGRWG